MPTQKHKINRHAQAVTDKWKDEAVGPLNLLSLHIHGVQKTLPDIVIGWLKERGPGIALLTGPLGSGKTIASCQIPEQILTHPGHPFDGAVLWVPFRDTNLFANDPDESIKKLLRITDDLDIWCRDSNLKCIILDGIDEAISIHGYENAMKWLTILFDRAAGSTCKPKIMICGRDAVLAKSIMDPRLYEKIKAYCDHYCTIPMKDSSPLIWQINAWDEETPWRIMKEWLTAEWGIRTAYELTRHIDRKLLSSPLLFGLACDVLKEIAEIRQSGKRIDFPFFATEWTLTSYWIDRINQRNSLKYNLKTDSESRRHVAQEIALFLALTDNGTSGIKLNELKELKGKGFTSLTQNYWENDALELKFACFLREYNECLTMFHEVILVHLAAEAIDRLSREGKKSGHIKEETDYQNTWWDWFAQTADLPGFTNLITIMEKLVTLKALQPGSTLAAAISYWLRHKLPTNRISVEKSSILESKRLYDQIDDQPLSLQFSFLFRNIALRYLEPERKPGNFVTYKVDANFDHWPILNIQSLTISDQRSNRQNLRFSVGHYFSNHEPGNDHQLPYSDNQCIPVIIIYSTFWHKTSSSTR